MVQRLASPPLIPTSQHAGTTTADSQAAMTALGSPSQGMLPSEVDPAPQVTPSGPEIPVPDTRQPSGTPGTGHAWKYTTASGKG